MPSHIGSTPPVGIIFGLWKRAEGAPQGLADVLAGTSAQGAGATWTNGPEGSGCTQPAVNTWHRSCHLDAGSGLAIAASARLDGRAALCDALGNSAPATGGDRELILRAYAQWGQECPNRLLGEFAFAVWDAGRESLFCARDHIGGRPFYYAATADRFVFASDINTVVATPGVSDALDEAAVATRLTHGGRPLGARTFLRAVRRLPPGHTLTVGRAGIRLDRWWRPEEVPRAAPATDAEYAEAFLDLYAQAIRDCVHGTDRVGVHLSGGLDSSSIAVLATRELRRQGRLAPLAFSWLPQRGDNSIGEAAAAEYGRIEAVCRREGLRPFYCSPGVEDIVSFLRRDVTRGADDGALIHEEAVQRCARGQGVEVLLSGWGGDEGISFHGRGYYQQLLRSGRVGRLWREARTRSRHPIASVLVNIALPLVFPGAAAVTRRLRQGKGLFRNSPKFVDPEFARRVRPLPAERRPRTDMRRMQLYLLQHGALTRRVEGWAESGRQHAIEYRYPLLDRRVLEFALGLPPEQYRRGRWNRLLMRRALDSVLSPEICWNANKEDPVRLNALRDACAEALPSVRRIIETRATPPSRGRYLDMPRLMAHLDADHFRGKPAPIFNALRFLDF